MMSKLFFAGLLTLGIAVTAAGDDPSTPSPIPSESIRLLPSPNSPPEFRPEIQARHLMDAAESLRLAGRVEAATALTKEAEQIIQPKMEELEAKRKLRDSLDQEIQVLERSLGCSECLSVTVQVCSVASDQCPNVLPPLWERRCPLNTYWVQHIRDMVKKKVVRVVAEPTLVVKSGQPASMMNGGEFPIIQVSGDDRKIEYREFGTRIEANAKCLGANRIHLDLILEQSNRDFNTKLESEGLVVPGLTTKRVNAQLDAKIGDTCFLQHPNDPGETIFYLIKVDKAVPLLPLPR